MTEERVAFAALALAMVVSAATLLWLNRGTIFSRDELVWVVASPHLGVDGALQPHGGHLILTSRLVYKLILETLGSGYLPFRLLATGAVLLTAGLFFLYARRRIGKVAALAPTLILLFFGSDSGHVLEGNAFTVLLAISCGLGALLVLEHDDLRRDVFACALLCLGVVTFSVALAFAVGVAVLVLLREDRWRRIWIIALPFSLYGAWWLWARGSPENSQDQLTLSSILHFPTWSFQSLSAALTALAGLDYDFSPSLSASKLDVLGQITYGEPGIPALGLLALAGLAWRLTLRRIPSTLWAALAVPLTLWLMGTLTSYLRSPFSNRYLYPGAVALLLVGAEATSGMRWTRKRLIILYMIVGVSLATNLNYLRVNGALLRNSNTPQVRATLSALDVAGSNANPRFDPGGSGLGLFNIRSDTPTAAYLIAAKRYGSLGYPLKQLRDQDPVTRAQADATLVGALGMGLRPAGPSVHGRACRKLYPQQGGRIHFALPAGGALLEAGAGSGSVVVRRFGDPASSLSIGELSSGVPAILRVPLDGAPDPWLATAPGASLLVCHLQ